MKRRISSRASRTVLLFAAVLSIFCGCSADKKEDKNSMDLNVLGKIMVCMREEGSGTKEVFSENIPESAGLEQVSYIAEGNDEVIAYVQNYPGAISAAYDFGMVSRELKSYEKELLDATKIAEDEIVLIVNENNPIRRMTMEEIGKIYDGTYTAWSNLKEEK